MIEANNLTQVEGKEGVITCPLHGLKFDSYTKKIIKLWKQKI